MRAKGIEDGCKVGQPSYMYGQDLVKPEQTMRCDVDASRKIKSCQRHRGRATHDGGEPCGLLFPSHTAAATRILGWMPHPYPLGLREIRSQAPLTNQQLTSNPSEK